MAHGSKVLKFGAAFAAFGMVLGSTAQAAPSSLGGVDPLVSLSAFGTSSSRAAVCAGGTAPANTAGLQSGASCLPFVAAASAAAAAQDTQQQQDDMGTAYAPVAEPRSTLSALALPFGVFALGVLLILLFDDDDDDDDDTISPN
jgi:hypothetical protein